MMNKTICFLVTGLILAVPACNYTDGACYAPGQGGGQPGTGPIVPVGGAGGFGADPKPQGAPGDADPCNKTDVAKVKRDLYCNGNVVCWNNTGPGASGCHHENTHVRALDPDAAVDELLKECQAQHGSGFDCEVDGLSCADFPKAGNGKVPIYVCNGAISPCKDSDGLYEACNYTAREVYAWSEPEAQEFLREECETVLAEKYGDTCEYGGFCCDIGSLTCNKQLTPP